MIPITPQYSKHLTEKTTFISLNRFTLKLYVSVRIMYTGEKGNIYTYRSTAVTYVWV